MAVRSMNTMTRRLLVSRRTRAVVAAGAAAALLAACTSAATGGGSATSSGGTKKAVAGGTATFADAPSDYFNWLFPFENSAADEPWEWNVETKLWRPLYFEGKDGKPVIDEKQSLAYPPVWSNHDRTVTIKLKPFKWSDGTPVTSRDVEFWFNLDKANKKSNALYVPGQIPDDVKSVAYPSADTIVFHLTASYSKQWFDLDQLPQIVPMPQQVWDRTSTTGKVGNYDRTTAGAKAVFTFLTDQSKELSTYATNPIWKTVDGPWTLRAYDPTSHDTTLVPNRKYSGPVKPKLDKYIIDGFTSNQSEANALRSGQLTFGYLTAPDYNLKKYFESHGYTVKPWKQATVEWAELGYTSKRYGPLVKQLYVRQALQRVVNQPLYNKTIFHGLGTATYGPVLNTPGNIYVSQQEKTNLYPYSVSAAKKLLTDHGWAPGPGGYMVCKRPGTAANQCGAGINAGRALDLSFMYATGWPAFTAEVEAYVQDAKQAGIKLDLNPESETTMFSNGGVCPPGPCNWGILMYENWMWDYGQGSLLPSGDTDFGTGNYWAGGYSSPTMDRLISKEQHSSGLQNLFNWENYTQKNLPVIFFPTTTIWSVVKNNLTGWQPQDVYQNPRAQLWAFTK